MNTTLLSSFSDVVKQFCEKQKTICRDYCPYELATTSSLYSRSPGFEIWDLKKKIYRRSWKNPAIFYEERSGILVLLLKGQPALRFSPQWQLQPWDQSRRIRARGARHPHCGGSAPLLCASFPANSGGSPPGSAFPPSDGHPGPQPQRSSPVTKGESRHHLRR